VDITCGRRVSILSTSDARNCNKQDDISVTAKERVIYLLHCYSRQHQRISDYCCKFFTLYRIVSKHTIDISPITRPHFSWPLLALPIDTPHIERFPPLVLFARERLCHLGDSKMRLTR